MVQSSLEREQSRDDLSQLGGTAYEDERTERERTDSNDDETEFDEPVKLKACAETR